MIDRNLPYRFLRGQPLKTAREAVRRGGFSSRWSEMLVSISCHMVSLCITDTCLLEWLCFLEVDIKFLQTMLCERKKS